MKEKCDEREREREVEEDRGRLVFWSGEKNDGMEGKENNCFKRKGKEIFQKGIEKKTGGFAFCFPREYILENDTSETYDKQTFFFF